MNFTAHRMNTGLSDIFNGNSVDKLLSRTVKVFSIYVEFAGIRELSNFYLMEEKFHVS